MIVRIWISFFLSKPDPRGPTAPAANAAFAAAFCSRLLMTQERSGIVTMLSTIHAISIPALRPKCDLVLKMSVRVAWDKLLQKRR